MEKLFHISDFSVRVSKRITNYINDFYNLSIPSQFGDAQNIGRWWLHVLVAYWILVSSVVLLNLFIALLSDTFQVCTKIKFPQGYIYRHNRQYINPATDIRNEYNSFSQRECTTMHKKWPP